MKNNIQQQLDKVLILNKEKKQALQVIKGTKTKNVGRRQVEISKEEKEQMTSKVNKYYDSKINTIYKSMNLELKEAGHTELLNPFENMKGEN